MTAQLPSRVYRIGNPENDEHHFTDKKDHADIAKKNGYEVSEYILAACEQEPVAYMYRDNLHTDARFSLKSRFGNWSPEDISEYEISETPLYAHPAPSIPTVPVGDRGDFETFVRSIPNGCNELAVDAAGFYKNSKVHYMFAAWNACRTAMQPNVTLTYEGDNHTEHNLGMVNHIGEDTGTDEVKPVTAATVPAGYVLVPVEPTQEMIDAHVEGVQSGGMRKGYRAMLASAPAVSDGWIPVSERMPDKAGFYLCWGTYFDGAEPDYIPASFFIHPTNGWSKWEPVEDDCDPNCVTITHWQPLPDAPKVKS